MTADGTMGGLVLRPAGVTAPQLAAYADLLSRVFGPSPKFSAEAIAWRYRDNPSGQVVGTDAWDGERLAAHYVTCATEAVIDGTPTRGLLSLNTATDPEYQGRGLFTRLAEATYEAGRAAGYAFVIGVANANSTPGFLRRLAFQHVAPLQAGVLLRAPRRFEPATLQFRGDWRDDLLAWRLANPAGRYVVARHGELIGVWSATQLPLIHCGAFLPGGSALPLQARGPLGATLFIGLEPRWRLAGFLPIPERSRPSPLNLIWRPLADGVPRELRADATALNFLDFDPY
jgi:GNAT superfamily N-acetyltransferase